jgi:NitT/TauT family transport system permease protein
MSPVSEVALPAAAQRPGQTGQPSHLRRWVDPGRLGRWGWPVLGLLVFLAVWEAVPALGLLPPTLLPPPSILPATWWQEVVDGHWLAALQASLTHYLIGLAIGTTGGVALGVAMALSPRLDASLSWVVRILRPVPGLAWIPFAILWFGVSPASAVFIIVIGVFWINLFAAYAAVQAVEPELFELAEAFGYRGRAAKLVPVILPAAAPGILAGVRTGLGQAWMAVVAAELFGVEGLGQRMMQASSLLATEIVVVMMLTIAALYGIIDTLFVALRNHLLRWQA